MIIDQVPEPKNDTSYNDDDDSHLVILGIDVNIWPGEQQLHQVVPLSHLLTAINLVASNIIAVAIPISSS